VDEAVIRQHVGISKDPAIMPYQLRNVADKPERDDLLALRVMPSRQACHRGCPARSLCWSSTEDCLTSSTSTQAIRETTREQKNLLNGRSAKSGLDT
jgi:hypothetical protein